MGSSAPGWVTRIAWVARVSGVVCLLLWAGAGCERSEEVAGRRATAPRSASTFEARLPAVGGARWPALVEVAGEVDGERLAGDAEVCARCHADVVAQWQSSAHAFSSFDNPVYRAAVDRFRAEQGREASRFCAGCHDPALLVDGATEAPISPRDPRAGSGVSCLVCHGITSARVDGNGSYRLRGGALVLPTAGDPTSLEAHQARYKPLSGPALCASCHRSFMGEGTGHPHHLAGIDDYGDWLASEYGGSRIDRVDQVAPKTCRDCHMPAEEAVRGDAAAFAGVRSHRFAGGHTWLAAMRDDPEALAHSRQMLRSAAAVDLAAVRHEDGRWAFPAETASLAPGERVTLEVVVENRGTGHRFPGGTRDLQEVWLDVEVRDAEGTLLAAHDRHRFRTELLDDEGRPVAAHRVARFRADGYDTTIPPRDAVLVRYALVVPEDVSLPLQVAVELWHESRDADLQREACLAIQSRRGLAFAQTHEPLDACRPQPRTSLSKASVVLAGRPPPTTAAGSPQAKALARRALLLGRAWTHALVEETDAAHAPLVRSLELFGGDAFGRAAAALELARVDAKQGRIEAMTRWLDVVEAAAPGQAAAAWVRGRALAAVFRHDEAATWLRVAAASSPRDPRVWSALAEAQGSAGRPRGSFQSSLEGLLAAPRDEGLLRLQALSSRALSMPASEQSAAFEAYLTHRAPDMAPALRVQCERKVAGCEDERLPAHSHRLEPPR